MKSYEFNDGSLWFNLAEILSYLKLSDKDTFELRSEEAEDFKTLIDGTEIISEPGFYYLMLFVADTSEAKKFQEWL